MCRPTVPGPAPVSSAADLAVLRALAEEGRNRPLLGGRVFLLFGAAISLAALGHYLIVTGTVDVPLMALAPLWFVTMGGASIVARAAPFRKTPGDGETVGRVVEREVWRVAGIFFAIFAISIFLLALSTGAEEDYRFFAMVPPVIFGVYGVAMAASIAASRATFLRPYAIAAMAFSALTTFLAGTAEQYLAMAIGALCVSVLPGMALLRHERADG